MDRDTIYAQGVKLPAVPDDMDAEEFINTTEHDDSEFLDRVLADVSFGEGFYADRNRLMRAHSRWFFGQHYDTEDPTRLDYPATQSASNDGNEHLVTLNIPHTSILRAHTMMTNEDPAIEVLSNRRSKGQVEQFLYGVIHTNTVRWDSDPISDAIFDQLLRGWGVLRVTWNPTGRTHEDDKFEGDRPLYEFPIEVVAMDPIEIYPIPGGTRERWSAICQVSNRRVFEVEDEWDVKLHRSDADISARREAQEKASKSRRRTENVPDPNEPLNRDDIVQFVDYWAWQGDKIMHAVVANDQFVKRPTWMKNYDSLPFVIFFCTKTTVKDRGEYFGLPANYALVDSVAELEWLINRHARIVDMYADPTIVIKKVNNNAVEDMVTSGIIEITEGESVNYLQFTGSMPDMDRLEAFFTKQIEEDGFGFPRGGGESGLDTIAQQQAGLVKIFKPVENAEDAIESMCSKIIGLLQRYSWDKPIRVVGRRGTDSSADAFSLNVKGSDTKGMRNISVRIRAKFPLEELRNAATANILVNSELYPREMAMKRFLHIQDTDEALDTIDRDRIRRNPQLSEQLIAMRLQELLKSSTVMEMVNDELEGQAGVPVDQRQTAATQGPPENPAPIEPGPLSQNASQFEAAAQQGAAGVGMPPDNQVAAAMGMMGSPDMGGLPRG